MKKWEDSLKERLAASPEYAAEYLSAVLEENDPEALRLALQHVAEAQGANTATTTAARLTALRLQHVAEAQGANTVIETASSREVPSLTETLDALGMHLLIAPKQIA